jgi:hypothetical protein
LCCTGTTPPLMCVSGECAPQYPDAGGPKDGGTTCAPCGSNPCCTGSCTVFADGGSVCN